jgi:hypothetical protein
MTAIHRRKMLGVMLGVPSSHRRIIPDSSPAEGHYIVLPTGCVIGLRLCPAAFAAARCAGGAGESNLLLALAHATWLGQAFAHCSLTAWPLIPFHFTLDQNIKRDPFKSEDLESKTYSVHFKPGGALQIPLAVC